MAYQPACSVYAPSLELPSFAVWANDIDVRDPIEIPNQFTWSRAYPETSNRKHDEMLALYRNCGWCDSGPCAMDSLHSVQVGYYLGHHKSRSIYESSIQDQMAVLRDFRSSHVYDSMNCLQREAVNRLVASMLTSQVKAGYDAKELLNSHCFGMPGFGPQ